MHLKSINVVKHNKRHQHNCLKFDTFTAVESALKMKAAGFSEMLVTIYRTIWHYYPQDYNLQKLLLCMLVGLFNDEFSVKMNSVSAPNLV